MVTGDVVALGGTACVKLQQLIYCCERRGDKTRRRRQCQIKIRKLAHPEGNFLSIRQCVFSFEARRSARRGVRGMAAFGVVWRAAYAMTMLWHGEKQLWPRSVAASLLRLCLSSAQISARRGRLAYQISKKWLVRKNGTPKYIAWRLCLISCWGRMSSLCRSCSFTVREIVENIIDCYH